MPVPATGAHLPPCSAGSSRAPRRGRSTLALVLAGLIAGACGEGDAGPDAGAVRQGPTAATSAPAAETSRPPEAPGRGERALADSAAEAAPGERFGTVEQLPPRPEPHWVWIADAALNAMPDGRAYLVDADTGRFLGSLNTGYSFVSLALPRHYEAIYSPETYYSRHTRGERTDVVSIYDPATLSPQGEIELPAKRGSTIPRLYDAALSDNDRFLAVFNITPATSLSLVDLEARRLVAEIDIPGCAMAYPAGPRRLFSLCTDGSLLITTLDKDGTVTEKTRSDPFFDVRSDPVSEHAVRDGDTWLFVSIAGRVHPVDLSGEQPRFPETWSLLTPGDRAAGWRLGGLQHLALHRAHRRLYAIAHRGPRETYEAPGPEIWIFDLERRARVRRIEAAHLTQSIVVTRDDDPLLLALAAEVPRLDVYDAGTGTHLRTIDELGLTPALLQVPWWPDGARGDRP